MRWGREGKERAVSQMISVPEIPLDLHLSCTYRWLAFLPVTATEGFLQMEGGRCATPGEPQKSNGWGLEDKYSNSFIPWVGQLWALSCTIPQLPGEVKSHPVAVLSCSLMLLELAPLLSHNPLLYQCFLESPPNETICTLICVLVSASCAPYHSHFSIWAFQNYEYLIPATMYRYCLDKNKI